MHITRLSALAFLLLVSQAVHAQRVPTSLAILALSPLVAVLLAGLLGIVVRSWRVGILHVGLLVTWVVILLFVAQHLESVYKTYIIWIPIIGYAAHALLILVLLIVHLAKRLAAHDGAA